jgi:hypothetical protein
VTARDPRTVDRNGFVIGTDNTADDSRPSVGGLSSCVQRGDQIGVIVGLESTDNGLVLHVVWIPGNHTSQRARRMWMGAHEEGLVTAEQVPAEGLVALDVWLPGVTR